MENSDIFFGLFEKGKNERSENTPTQIEDVEIQLCFHDILVDMKTTQKFSNQSEEPVELEYKYRSDFAPHNLVVTLFDPETGKKDVLQAKIHTKEAAVERYDDSISRGNRAVLMERDEEKENLYCLSLGNVKPKMEITVVTEVVTAATLETDDGDPDRINFLYSIPPLTTDEDGEEEEESKIMSLKIITKNAESISCPSHIDALASQGSGIWETRSKIGVSEEVELIVSYLKHPFSSFSVSPVRYEGYKYAGVLSLLPNFAAQRAGGSELILIIDCSGSMIGERMKCAVEALRLFLQSLDLNRKIRFNIIRFGSNYQKLFPNSVLLKDDENLKKAKEFIITTRANMGGTNMLRPIQSIFEEFKEKEKEEEEAQKDPMINEVEKCVQQNVCTQKVTGKRFVVQKWFQCSQCGMAEWSGCCESCAETCHSGHFGVSEAENSPSPFYCDCEAENSSCVASKNVYDPNFILPELDTPSTTTTTTITEEEEEDNDNEVYTKQLFLFTDGEDEFPKEIEKLVGEKHEEMGLRVFSFGIGKGINQEFLQNCADLTRGSACFIENIKEQMISQVLRQLSNAFRASIDNISIVKGLDKKTCRKASEDISSIPKVVFNGRSHHEYFFLEELPEEIVVKYDFLGISSEEKVEILRVEDLCIGVGVAHEFIKTLEKFKRKKEIQTLGISFNIPTDYTSFFMESETEDNVVSEMKVEKVLLKKKTTSGKKNRMDDYIQMASMSNPALLSNLLHQRKQSLNGRVGVGSSSSMIEDSMDSMMSLSFEDSDDEDDIGDDGGLYEAMKLSLYDGKEEKKKEKEEEGRRRRRGGEEDERKHDVDFDKLISLAVDKEGEEENDSDELSEANDEDMLRFYSSGSSYTPATPEEPTVNAITNTKRSEMFASAISPEKPFSPKGDLYGPVEPKIKSSNFEDPIQEALRRSLMTYESESSKPKSQPVTKKPKPIPRNEEGEGESEGGPKVKESVSHRNLNSLLFLSDMKGIWEVKKEVLRLIGFSSREEFIKVTKPDDQEALKKKEDEDGLKYWLTSIILAILNKFYKKMKSSWRLIARKSMRSICEEMDESIIVAARKIVNGL